MLKKKYDCFIDPEYDKIGTYLQNCIEKPV